MTRALLLLVLAVLFAPRHACGQIADSTGRTCLVPASASYERRIDRRRSTRAYRMTFVAMPLIVGGLVMKPFDDDFRELRNDHARSFDYHYDDYVQYLPMATMFGMKAFGVRSRSSWGRMLVSDAFSAALMATAVNSLKYSCKVMRPDGSTRNSFPSGHTATAFMAATMLHKEYGHLSPWVSVGGYTVATLTGVSRQLNNRHWVSDVMVGAGIGILATELGYFFADLIYKRRGLNVEETMLVYDRYRCPSFLSFSLGLSTMPGSYRLGPSTRVELMSGPSVGVEGAWFRTPYWGIGGRLSSSYLRVSVNNVSQTENLKCASASAGLYLSYPFSVRWLLGSKLLSGYEGYKSCNTDTTRLGGCGGFQLGTGVSATYLASQNFGVRFLLDYDMAPPMVRSSHERLHRVTLGLAVAAVF